MKTFFFYRLSWQEWLTLLTSFPCYTKSPFCYSLSFFLVMNFMHTTCSQLFCWIPGFCGESVERLFVCLSCFQLAPKTNLWHEFLISCWLSSFRESDGLSSVDVTKDLSEMSLATPPLPFTYETATATRGELVAKAHKNLPSISSMFVGSFNGTRRALVISR